MPAPAVELRFDVKVEGPGGGGDVEGQGVLLVRLHVDGEHLADGEGALRLPGLWGRKVGALLVRQDRPALLPGLHQAAFFQDPPAHQD